MAFSFSERVMSAWKRCKSSETFRPHSFTHHLPYSDVLESHEVLWGGLFPSMSIHCDNADYKISKTNKNEWCKKKKGILNISLTFLIEHSCYLFFPEFFGGRGGLEAAGNHGKHHHLSWAPIPTNTQNDVPTSVTQKAISAHPTLTAKREWDRTENKGWEEGGWGLKNRMSFFSPQGMKW